MKKNLRLVLPVAAIGIILLLTAIKGKNELNQPYKIGYVRYQEVFNKFYDLKVLGRRLDPIGISISIAERKHQIAGRNFNAERKRAAERKEGRFKEGWLKDIDVRTNRENSAYQNEVRYLNAQKIKITDAYKIATHKQASKSINEYCRQKKFTHVFNLGTNTETPVLVFTKDSSGDITDQLIAQKDEN